jgi:hypothetical protein
MAAILSNPPIFVNVRDRWLKTGEAISVAFHDVLLSLRERAR